MNSYVEDYIEKLKEYSGYKYLVRKYKREYNLLFDDLFSIEFRWHVALDAKRIDDAEYYIRDKFDDGTLEKLGCPVSVLEVLLAMSYRCEHDVMGSRGDSKFYFWFWEFLENFGLLEFSDDLYEKDAVFSIVNDWLDDRYDPYFGKTPFPVKKLKTAGQMAIANYALGKWNFMCKYLSENYI